MKRSRLVASLFSLCSILICGAVLAAENDPVVVRQVEKGVEVGNGYYTVKLAEPMGYGFMVITDRRTGTGYVGASGLILRKRWERKSQRPEAMMPNMEWVTQSPRHASLEVTEQGPEVARLIIHWSDETAEVTETLRFTRDSRFVDIDCRIRSKSSLDYAQFAVSFRDFSPKSLFYPDRAHVATHVSSVLDCGKRRPAPAAAFAFDPDAGTGLGLAALNTPDNVEQALTPYVPHRAGTLTYGFYGPLEGYDRNSEWVSMVCSSRQLTWDPVGAEHHLKAKLIVGWDAAAARELKLELIRLSSASSMPPVVIERARPRKLIFRTRESGEAAVTLSNRTSSKQTPRLVCEIVSGIDERRVVFNKPAPLQPEERKEIIIHWPATTREYGYEFNSRILLDSKLVDSKSDFFAVADQSSKVAQMTVANPGWFNRFGMEKWLIPALRDSYTGIMEYYCWAPSHLYDLTPDTEEFRPHTESNAGAYRATLTRTFIKSMIARAHEEGLRVVAELAQMASLPTALQHPEELIYTEDGQPYVFIRKVFDNTDEYAVVVVNYFTPERVRRWADEMAASVKMFGWDGVRFDCGWIPSFGNPDPLHASDKKEYLSYDANGKVLHVDDPDGVGEQLAHVWRTRMTQKCPGFEYMSNHSQPEQEQRKYPKTNRAMAESDGGLLQEDRLGVTSADMHTWELWAAALRNNGRGVRENGGHPLVGWMLGGPAVSTRVRHYVAFASGYRMYGSGGTGDVDDPTPDDYRFALRFSEYLYDPGLKYLQLDQQRVQVTPDDRILWKPFVYERSLGNRMCETIVDLVNLPNSDEVLWHHDPPTIKRNVRVTMTAPRGYCLDSAWMLVPDPQPHAMALTARTVEGKVILEVPELISMAIVVGRFAKVTGPSYGGEHR